MKTFEEELKGLIESIWFDGFETANALGRNDPRFGNEKEELQSDVSIAFEKITAAHQAEMDRVVEEVVGPKDTRFSDAGNMLCNDLINEQRARYKAIKEGK